MTNNIQLGKIVLSVCFEKNLTLQKSLVFVTLFFFLLFFFGCYTDTMEAATSKEVFYLIFVFVVGFLNEPLVNKCQT